MQTVKRIRQWVNDIRSTCDISVRRSEDRTVTWRIYIGSLRAFGYVAFDEDRLARASVWYWDRRNT